MPRLPSLTLLLILVMPAASLAADRNSEQASPPSQAPAGSSLAPQPSPHDRSFIEQFIASGIAESELAELAVKKSRQPQVNALARQLASDSRATSERLRTLTRPLGLASLPEAPDADHRTLLEQLAAASPQDFDRLYVDSQVRDHEDQVSVLEMQVSSGDDAELKKFAADLLPLVREHLQRCRQLSDFLKAQR